MELRASIGDIIKLETEALIVNLFQGVEHPGGATGAVDRALDGAISDFIASGEIRGRAREITLLHTFGRITPRRVLVVGLGKQEELRAETVRAVTAEAARFLRRKGITQVATIAHGAGSGGLDPKETAQAIAEGSLLGLYQFTRHKKPDAEQRAVEELVIIDQNQAKLPALEEGIATGRVLAEATMLCRDLVNEPSNYMTPTHLAEVACRVAEEEGLEVTVLDKPQMEELGMGALLGVARGSHEPPKFIVLRYWGDRENEENNVALIGKGITFDSGGISIKGAAGMSAMKGDMAGASSVISAMKAISHLKPRINVTALAACAENLPGGSAQKPGDVVRAMSGKTIEVENTDAEGRLVLADALSYARLIGLHRLVDVATLTGAMRGTLGTVGTGVFGTDQELVDRLIKAGQTAGEKMWQLPLWQEFKEQNRSEVADVKNTGGSAAGSATAAWFLAEFAEDTPWVHLDIAGTARSDTEKGTTVKGATGVPVRTLVTLVLDMASS